MRNPLYCIRGDKTQGWFMLFRTWYGFTWKDTSKLPLIFSERIGARKGLRIGKYLFHWLKPM